MSLKEFVTIVSFCVYLKSFITQKDYRNIDLIMYNFTFKRERKYVHIMRSQKLMPYTWAEMWQGGEFIFQAFDL